jgi:threonine dehydratase
MSDFVAAARAATAAMRTLFPPTPLLRNEYLSRKYAADIWLKREDLSPVRSYKIRGAFNAMRKRLAIDPDQRQFVCASAGNHAQGVAFACRHFGVRGTIFMPVTTPQQKIMKTRAFGGDQIEIKLTGDIFDQSLAAAQVFCAQTGGYFLSPFDDPDVIEGQASVAVEMLAQLGHAPDMVVLPVGGGGLGAGMTTYLSQAAPATAMRYVEPVGGASLTAALAQGAPVTLSRLDSFVDGASVARIGAQTFARLSQTQPEHVLLAPENRICITILDMLNVEGIVLEPAGALSLDVLPLLADQIRGACVVCVASGGNFDFERLPEVKERAMRHAGTKKYLLLRLPQRPGALRDFLSILGPDDDIARFEYLKKTARNFGSVLLGLETTAPENFAALFDRMRDAGFAFTDITDDEVLANFVI